VTLVCMKLQEDSETVFRCLSMSEGLDARLGPVLVIHAGIITFHALIDRPVTFKVPE
jgi:hypothetical protein